MSKLSDLGLDLEQRRKINQLATEHGYHEFLAGWYSAMRDIKHAEHSQKATRAIHELSNYLCWTEDL